MTSPFGGGALTAKYSTGYHHGGALAYWDRKGAFTLMDVPRMERDPQVLFADRVLRAPVHTATWTVKSKSDEVAHFVDQTLKALWRRDLSKILNMLRWGAAGGEAVYDEDAHGKVSLCELLDRHIFDCIPVVQGGRQVGLNVKGVTGAGKVELRGPRWWWVPNEPQFGAVQGRSRWQGMWEPWVEKSGFKGARDIRRTWFFKNAFRGGVIRHPQGVIELENGQLKSNEDYARELLEKFETGGILVLPNAVNPTTGEYLWTFEPPASNGDVRDVREYPKDLDTEILIGAGVPSEVVQAADTGSGYAGRAVPALVFYTSEDQIVDAIIQHLDRVNLRPMVQYNYGADARYVIEPVSLVPKPPQGGDGQGGGGKQAPGPGQPQPPGQPQEKPPALPGVPKPPEQVRLSQADAEGGAAPPSPDAPAGDEPPGRTGDEKELAAWYADLLNGFEAHGGAPQSVLDAARHDLWHGEWVLARDPDSGTWQVHHADDVEPVGVPVALSQERSPKGTGITIHGKHYKPGQWIPAAVVASASPEEKAELEKTHKEKSAARQARGSVDVGALAANLAPHAAPLDRKKLGNARRAFAALHRHHGALTLHRIEELHGLLEKQLRDYASSPTMQWFLRGKLASLHAMLGMAATKGVTGQVEKPKAEPAKAPGKGADREAISKRLDELLSPSGPHKAAADELKKQTAAAESNLRVGTNEKGEFVVNVYPGGWAVSRKALTVAGPFATEEEANRAWVDEFERHVKPFKDKVQALKDEQERLLKAEAAEQERGVTGQVAAPVKEPWQMTREEAARKEYDFNQNNVEPHKRRSFDKAVADLKAAGGTDKDVQELIDLYIGGEKTGHRAAVKSALAAGKPVPPEVLADYPDLQVGATGQAEGPEPKAPPAESEKANASPGKLDPLDITPENVEGHWQHFRDEIANSDPTMSPNQAGALAAARILNAVRDRAAQFIADTDAKVKRGEPISDEEDAKYIAAGEARRGLHDKLASLSGYRPHELVDEHPLAKRPLDAEPLPNVVAQRAAETAGHQEKASAVAQSAEAKRAEKEKQQREKDDARARKEGLEPVRGSVDWSGAFTPDPAGVRTAYKVGDKHHLTKAEAKRQIQQKKDDERQAAEKLQKEREAQEKEESSRRRAAAMREKGDAFSKEFHADVVKRLKAAGFGDVAKKVKPKFGGLAGVPVDAPPAVKIVIDNAMTEWGQKWYDIIRAKGEPGATSATEPPAPPAPQAAGSDTAAAVAKPLAATLHGHIAAAVAADKFLPEISLKTLYEKAKAAHPGLTVPEFHDELKRMRAAGTIRLTPVTRKDGAAGELYRSEYAIPDEATNKHGEPYEMYGYATLPQGKGAPATGAAAKASEPTATPAQPAAHVPDSLASAARAKADMGVKFAPHTMSFDAAEMRDEHGVSQAELDAAVKAGTLTRHGDEYRPTEAGAKALAAAAGREAAPQQQAQAAPVHHATGDPKAPLHEALQKGWGRLAGSVDNPVDGFVPLHNLYAVLKRDRPGLTVPQFHAELQRLWGERKVELHILNEVGKLTPEQRAQGIEHNGKQYQYVYFKPGAKLSLEGDAPDSADDDLDALIGRAVTAGSTISDEVRRRVLDALRKKKGTPPGS
jgi:hypothetical protein